MDSTFELRKYHLIEQLMHLSDSNVLREIEQIINLDKKDGVLKEEMIARSLISEKQFIEGKTKTHKQAKVVLSKWIK